MSRRILLIVLCSLTMGTGCSYLRSRAEPLSTATKAPEPNVIERDLTVPRENPRDVQ